MTLIKFDYCNGIVVSIGKSIFRTNSTVRKLDGQGVIRLGDCMENDDGKLGEQNIDQVYK